MVRSRPPSSMGSLAPDPGSRSSRGKGNLGPSVKRPGRRSQPKLGPNYRFKLRHATRLGGLRVATGLLSPGQP